MSLWMGLVLLIACSLGHAEWWVLFVNRVHALAIPHRRLRWARRVHDVAVPVFPVLLVWLAGLREPGLLTGGRLRDLPAWLQALVIITALGMIPLVAGILRWQLRQRHAFAQAEQRRSTDVRLLQTQQQISGDVEGPRPHLSRKFPWNEIYRVEINAKTIGRRDAAVSGNSERPAAAAEPLRIVHFSDLHFVGCPGEGFYRWLFAQAAELRPDAFAFTGDLIDDPALIPLAVELLGQLAPLAPCFFVLGNHDWRFDHRDLRRRVQACGWTDVGSQAVLTELRGRPVLVAGTELPWLGSAPAAAHTVDCDLRLLLSHSPDQVRFANQAGYDVMLAGHTHGGQVVLPVVGPVYSPSLYGVQYASGLFQAGRVQLHVSRGIGGKDPLRWRCSPELTCLHIHWPR